MSNVSRIEEARVKRISSSMGLIEFFDKNPERLVAYVASAVFRRASIPGIYVAHLAAKVGLVLEYGGCKHRMLWSGHVRPSCFSNIQDVLKVARGMFGRPDSGANVVRCSR